MDASSRIYVNRNVHLEKVQYVGFDLDYTLAEYNSPCYENMTIRYAAKELVEIGYPSEIETVTYDPKFGTRGVIFDKRYGNLLKVDAYGNIMTAIHGMTYLSLDGIRQRYRNKYINLSDVERFGICNTLFEFPAMFLICHIIKHFESQPEWRLNDTHTGVESFSLQVYYKTIYDDVKSVFDNVFGRGPLKRETIQNFNKYIKTNPRLPTLLKIIKQSGRKVFLVTNSEYWYTDELMNSLFKDADKNGPDYSNDWKTYFDIIVVEARKPLFFGEGTSMCQIDFNTGKRHIGVFKGKISPGDVFSGGSSELLCEIMQAHGKDILYVGDHIYGDILKSKKKQGWRTYLVVPELLAEMSKWREQRENYRIVTSCEIELSKIYRNVDSNTTACPLKIGEYLDKIATKTKEIEDSYGIFGSMFRCGNRQTLFANQMLRYADLYAHSCLNLLNYPFFYYFSAPLSLLSHEINFDGSDHSKVLTDEHSAPLLSDNNDHI